MTGVIVATIAMLIVGVASYLFGRRQSAIVDKPKRTPPPSIGLGEDHVNTIKEVIDESHTETPVPDTGHLSDDDWLEQHRQRTGKNGDDR